jgi:general secretion pathway protein J
MFKTNRQEGLTLIELLIAISILAIVAVLGWRGLDGITRARSALTTELELTRGMQLTFAQLQSDCGHIASQTSLPERVPLVADQQRLIMVRTVTADNQPTRLQVVAYRLIDGVLTRTESAATRNLSELDTQWAAIAGNPNAAQSVALQSGIASMRVRTWSTNSPGWRVSTDAMANTSAPNMAAMTGLEVSLQPVGRDTSTTKVFLLGAM